MRQFVHTISTLDPVGGTKKPSSVLAISGTPFEIAKIGAAVPIFLLSLFVFCSPLKSFGKGLANENSQSDFFMEMERGDKSQLSWEIMSDLGIRALAKAKIFSIKLSTLRFHGTQTFFSLPEGSTSCRQTFINELRYFVHTKCYRDGSELLNYVAVFPKATDL